LETSPIPTDAYHTLAASVLKRNWNNPMAAEKAIQDDVSTSPEDKAQLLNALSDLTGSPSPFGVSGVK
jgi:hypothetical protein